MNNERRKRISKLIETIEGVLCELEELRDEEEESLENMPENLQYSERYEISQDALNILENSCDSLEDITQELESIT